MTNEVVVQNGTEIASPVYVSLVARYRTFAKHTAENLIKLAQILNEADYKLSKSELDRFCEEVGLKYDGSTYRKLLKIGKEASRFEPFTARMPNNWTTVYRLARLEKDKFERVANDNRFSPMMTAKDVEVIVGTTSKGIEHKRDVTIDLTGLDERVKVDVCQAMKTLEKQFGFHVKFSEEIERLANRRIAA